MRTQLVSFEQVEGWVAGPGLNEGNGNRAEIRQAGRLLHRAVEEDLTERQRQCVQLYFFEGLTMEQAGMRLGLEKSTVYRHLERAKRRLSRVMKYSLSRSGEGFD